MDVEAERKRLIQMIQSAKRTGDMEEVKELEAELEALGQKLEADALSASDRLQGVLSKAFGVDAVVGDDTDEKHVLIELSRPVPLVSVLLAFSNANLAPSQDMKGQQIVKHGKLYVLRVYLSALRATAFVMSSGDGQVQTISVA